jgi:hypothetical protein
MTDKKCTICDIILNNENKTKRSNKCKSCTNLKYKEYVKTKLTENYNSNVERKCSYCSILLTSENQVKNRPNCKPCYNQKCKEYKKNNKNIVTEYRKKYYDKNKEDIAEYYKIHYKENKDTYMENNKIWRENNREHTREKENERNKTNENLRLRRNCRTRIHSALKKYDIKKNKKTLDILDCDIGFLKTWLEFNFKEGMTLENYGPYWHVDHVIPCSLFNLVEENQMKECFHWTNLQPLKGSDNCSKQNKLDEEEVINHYKRVHEFATIHGFVLNVLNYKKYFTLPLSKGNF